MTLKMGREKMSKNLKMSIKFVDESRKKSKVLFTNVDISIVNSVRRVILRNIPVVACRFDPENYVENDIKFHKNNSSLFNEFLGHRIALIPVHFSEEETENFEQDKYNFIINQKNSQKHIISVTSKDIKVVDEKGANYDELFVRRLFPANDISDDHVLIAKLKPNILTPEKGEELHIEYTCIKRTAEELGSAFSPVSLCAYEFLVDGKKADAALKEKLKSETDTAKITNDFNALHRQKFYKTDSSGAPVEILLKLESECGLSCRYLLKKAFEILIEQLEEIEENTSLITSLKHLHYKTHYIEISNMDHTLGNLISSFGNKTLGSELLTIGYNMPHPLEKKTVFMLVFKKPHTETEAVTFLKEKIIECKAMITQLLKKMS